jgi:hypothetical protein
MQEVRGGEGIPPACPQRHVRPSTSDVKVPTEPGQPIELQGALKQFSL